MKLLLRVASVALLASFVACSKAPLAPSSALAADGASSSSTLFETASAGVGVLILSGSATTVPFGSYTSIRIGLSPRVSSLRWNFGDGTTSTLFRTVIDHFYPAPGHYHASLVAVAFDGSTDSADGFIDVLPAVLVPNPVLPNPTPPIGGPTLTVVLSAVAVRPAGSPTVITAATTAAYTPAPSSYSWDCANDGIVDATTATNSFPCVYRAAGTYTASVRVTNGTLNQSATLTGTIAAPTVTVAVTCTAVAANTASACGVTAALNGDAVPAANITAVDWTFGDGAVATTATPSVNHTYLAPGPYLTGATITIATVNGAFVGTGSVVIQ